MAMTFYSLVKTMSAYCTIYILADINEQVLIKKRNKENYKYDKTARLTIVGTFVIAPISFTWINIAEKVLPGRNPRTVIKKILINQSCVAPFVITMWYITTNILEGKSDIFAEWREKFLKTWTTGMVYWPVCQFINFTFIPLQYRTTLFLPTCSFIRTTYLCYLKEHSLKKLQNDSASVQHETNSKENNFEPDK